MPDDPKTLLTRLIGGDQDAARQILARASTEDTPALLVAAALLTQSGVDLLDRAADRATSTRDRQLVAIADAHLRGDLDLVDALVRDHLADHPGSALATWIAAQPSPARPLSPQIRLHIEEPS
jgi:hypothetical protein